MRRQQYLADVAILVACVAFALTAGHHWKWGPFAVALAVVGIAAVVNELPSRVAVVLTRPTDEELRQIASWRRRRAAVLVPMYVTFAVGPGVIAGAIPAYWPDVALAAMFGLTGVVIPLAFLPRTMRKARVLRSDRASRSGPAGSHP